MKLEGWMVGGIVIIAVAVGVYLWYTNSLKDDVPRATPPDFTDRDLTGRRMTMGEEEEQAAMYGHYY